MAAETFRFRFDPRFRLVLRGFGASPGNSWVTVDDDTLDARFGWFRLSTPRSNVAGAEVTGPHGPLKAIGVRMSLADRGITFGSSAERTTCITFVERVRVQPVDVTGHPALTVSVDRPDDLAALLGGA